MSKNVLFHQLEPVKNISGGSGAETWIVKDLNNAVFVRKFAGGEAGRKLSLQTDWLNDFKNKVLCPEVLNVGQYEDIYFYDMNYLSSSETAFDSLLSKTSEKDVAEISCALKEFEVVFEHLPPTKNTANREKYLSEKFLKNIESIKEKDPAFAVLANADELNINGINYPGLKRLLSNSAVKNVMESVLSETLYSAGHGDLTLSNMLVQNERVTFIDPNPNFEFISKEQEYSKVLQSTVVKYELFANLNGEVSDRSIHYTYGSLPDFSSVNRALLASDTFKSLKLENLFFHLAIHLARILPYIKPENKLKSYVYFSEIIKLLNSVAKSEYNLN